MVSIIYDTTLKSESQTPYSVTIWFTPYPVTLAFKNLDVLI